MIILATPFWVRLLNAPIHLLSLDILDFVGNSLGHFINIDTNKLGMCIVTSTHIYVKLYLSKRLPNRILINWNGITFSQLVDYENKVFWCRSCQQLGYLHNAFPSSQRHFHPPNDKKMRRGWKDPKRPKGSKNSSTHKQDNMKQKKSICS